MQSVNYKYKKSTANILKSKKTQATLCVPTLRKSPIFE